MNKKKILSFVEYFSKILLLVLAISLFVFALLSGSEKVGIVRNSPNALPWLIMIIFICIAFWRQVLGGILIVLFGIFTILFFSAVEVVWILFLISMPLIILGSIIILCGFLDKR